MIYWAVRLGLMLGLKCAAFWSQFVVNRLEGSNDFTAGMWKRIGSLGVTILKRYFDALIYLQCKHPALKPHLDQERERIDRLTNPWKYRAGP